jgi:hypothetical protein
MIGSDTQVTWLRHRPRGDRGRIVKRCHALGRADAPLITASVLRVAPTQVGYD